MKMAYFDKIQKKEEETEISETHSPIIEIEKNEEVEIYVKIGNKLHVSEQDHFIQWIEICDGEIPLGRAYLSHFTKPILIFYTKKIPENLKIRVFCNKHGVWESEPKK